MIFFRRAFLASSVSRGIDARKFNNKETKTRRKLCAFASLLFGN